MIDEVREFCIEEINLKEFIKLYEEIRHLLREREIQLKKCYD